MFTVFFLFMTMVFADKAVYHHFISNEPNASNFFAMNFLLACISFVMLIATI